MSLDQPSRRALVTGLVGALGGGAYFLTRSGDTATQEQVSSFHSSDETSAFGIDLTGKPIMGSPDAPIQIYYWTDFQCPFCEQFERETLPELVPEYVESGDVRIVFISLPYFGEDSMTAAVASKCVWDQVRDAEPSAYWNWHTAIFEEQGEKNSGWASSENLLEYTRSVDGVDADALETCLDERRSTLETQVNADAEKARSLGVSGTPTFAIVNREAGATETLVGAQPKTRFDEAIERVQNE
ncbi:DsbA family protein [Natrinema sp. HArc-T2]|uniref:DsbA family protein n=1 Tax=Natrinema sp. HArc-T2 TaxID=3242701 RepID=UPI00359EEBFD